MFTRITAVLLSLALLFMGSRLRESTYLIVKYVLLVAFLLAMLFEDRGPSGLVPRRTIAFAAAAMAVTVFLDLTNVNIPVSVFLGISLVCALAFFRERWGSPKAG